MFRLLPLLLVGLLSLPSASCTKAPPNLTPAGKAAFQKTQVLKSLDLLRDIAIDAEANGVLHTADARKIVSYHRDTVAIMQASDLGWKAAVATGLDVLVKELPPDAGQKIAPYVALLKVVLAEVGS